MAVSYSKEIDEKNIPFNSNSLLNNDMQWEVLYGECEFSDIITIEAHSACRVSIDTSSVLNTIQYLKIVASTNCEDRTVSTDSEHKLSMMCKVELLSNDNSTIVNETFYPKFKFESLVKDDIVGDYSVAGIDNKKLGEVVVTIYNEYDFEVIVESTGLYYSETPADSTYLNSEEYLNNLFNSYANGLGDGKYPLVIPLVYELPDIDDVPDGFICRLYSIDAQ